MISPMTQEMYTVILLMLHCSIVILFMHLPFISSKDSLLYIAIPLIRLPYQSL